MSAPPRRPSGSSSEAMAGRIVITPISTRQHRGSLTTLRSRSALRFEVQTLGDVPGDGDGIQANPAEPDMAVGTHEIERGLSNPRACQLRLVGRISGDPMDVP